MDIGDLGAYIILNLANPYPELSSELGPTETLTDRHRSSRDHVNSRTISRRPGDPWRTLIADKDYPCFTPFPRCVAPILS